MEKSVYSSNESYSRWTLFISCTKNWFVLFLLYFHSSFFLSWNHWIEVEYDAKRDEKEQHELKMREVRKVEELRKEREALGKLLFLVDKSR